jgi:hypothetical protein
MSVDYKGIDEKNVQDAIDATLVEAASVAAVAAAGVVEDAIVNAVSDKAPSQNAVFDALELKANSSDIEDALVDGVTIKAPSQNAVFDALELKQSKASIFVSAIQTGIAGEVDIAHGLGSIPSKVIVVPVITVGAVSLVEGVHDATNIKVTCTLGDTFKVLAFV